MFADLAFFHLNIFITFFFLDEKETKNQGLQIILETMFGTVAKF
tara:strand:- start:5449 stop:5580 length:132 start_codon:yes stop_codon:yes gene_type:complete